MCADHAKGWAHLLTITSLLKSGRHNVIAVVVATTVVLILHPGIFPYLYSYLNPISVPRGVTTIQMIDPVELSKKFPVRTSQAINGEDLVFSDALLKTELAHYVGVKGYNTRIHCEMPRPRVSSGESLYFQTQIEDVGERLLESPYLHILIIDASGIIFAHYPNEPQTYPTFLGKWYSDGYTSRVSFLESKWYSFRITPDLDISRIGKWYVALLVFDKNGMENRCICSTVAAFEVTPRTSYDLLSSVRTAIGITATWLSTFLPIRQWWPRIEPYLDDAVRRYWYMIFPIVITAIYLSLRWE